MASENGSKVTTNSLLCETCVGMFTVEPLPDRNLSGMEVMRMPENPHHPSLQSLLDAAEKGCYICSYVVRQFERHGGKLHDVDNKTDIPAESMPATTYIIRPVLGSQVDEFTVWVSVTKHALQPGSTERCFHWVIRDVSCLPSLNAHPSDRLDLLQQWATECVVAEPTADPGGDAHAICGHHREAARLAPLRRAPALLQLSPAQGSHQGRVRLVATGADEKRSPLSEPYVAMTYPWAANALPPRHEKLTLGGDWLPIDEVLPRAVQEAAMLTLAAGLTYLWVEYICAGGDDRQQCVAVGERGDILAASAFNIAACSAPTVDSPLLPDSSINPPQPAIPVLRLTHAGPSAIANEADSPTSGLFAINHDDLFLDSLDDGAMDALPPLHTLPVYHHALLLSPATLFVTKQQLFWRCAASRSPAFPRASGPLRCETYPFGCGSGSDPGATGVNGAALHHANERYGTSPKRFMDIEIFGADEGSDSGNGYAVFGERVAALWCEIVKVLAGTEGSVQDRAEVAKNVAHHLRILSSGTAAAPAKQEFDSPHVVYSSGLWLFPTLGEPSGSHRVLHVVEPLLWHVKSHALLSSQRLDAKATTLDGDDPKPPPQQQPSWSWLSARGTVAYVFHGAYGQCMPAIYPSFGGSTSPGGEVGAISMTRRAPAVAEVVDIRRAAATVDGTSAGGMDQLVLRGRILPVAIREVPSPLWRLPGEEPCPPVLAATVLGLPPPKEQTATSDCKTPHMAMNALRIMPDSPHEWSRLHEAAAATAAVEAEPAGQKQDEAAKEEFAALPLTGIKLSATPYQNESMAVQGLLLRKVNKDKHHIGKDGVLYRRCGLFMCDHVWPGETLNWEALRLDDEALKETVVVV